MKVHLVKSYCLYIKNNCNKYNFSNPVFGLARTLLALSTIFSILLVQPHLLFNPTNILNPNYEVLSLHKISIFYLLRNHLVFAKWISLFILLIVASGYRPRYTSLFHWYIAFSFSVSSYVIEGGDQIAQNLTLLFIPFFIFDKRKNHWLNEPYNFKTNSWILLIYFLIRLQACFIYLQASIGKLKINEWRDGTALYYWLNNNFVGSPNIIKPFINFITDSPELLTIFTWSSLIIEFLLFMCISSFKKQRKYFLIIGLVFHFLIFIFFGLFSFMLVMCGLLIIYLHDFKVKKNV